MAETTVYGRGGVSSGTPIYGYESIRSGTEVYGGDIVLSRYLPTLAGSQYGTIDTAITFTGDFEVEAPVAATSLTAATKVIAGKSSPGNWFGTPSTSGKLGFVCDTLSLGNITPVTVTPFDGKIHVWKLTRVGTTISLFIDDVLQSFGTGAGGNVTYDEVGATSSLFYWVGEIPSIKFTDQSGAEDIVTNFVFDSGSTTDQPSRGGGNNVTLVNFATTDWNRYTLQRNILHDAGTIAEAWVGDNGIDFPNLASQGTGWVFDGVLHKNADDATLYNFGAAVVDTEIYMVGYTKSIHTAGNPVLTIGAAAWVSPFILISDGASGSFASLLTANNSGTARLSGNLARLDINAFSVQKLLEVA